MRWVTLVLALLIETLFLMHHSDPDYFGLPLELYQILRVTAVVTTVLAALFFWLALRKKSRLWVCLIAFVPTLAPTAHWVAANDYFRVSMVLARGNVRPHKLIDHLKSYPKTKPQTVARWLLKQDRRYEPWEVFAGKQLAGFILLVPESQERYVEPVVKETHRRLARRAPDKQLAGYAAMVRRARRSRRANSSRAVAIAASKAMPLILKTKSEAELAALPASAAKLLADLRAQKATFPRSFTFELDDQAKGGGHYAFDRTFDRSGLLQALGALGLELKPTADKPDYKLKLTRSAEVRVTTFEKGKRKYTDVKVPLYTVVLSLTRGDGTPVVSAQARTPSNAFRFTMTSTRSKAGFQAELYRRSIRRPLLQLAKGFDVVKALYPEPPKPKRR